VGALLMVAGAVLVFDLRLGDGGRKKPAASPSPTVQLPDGVRCTGAACGGKDPEAMGCGGSHATTVTDAMVGPAYMEVRYSKVCAAAWARMARAGAGDEVRIRGDAGGAERRAEADADGDAYTSMVPVRSAKAATACILRTTGDRGCTQQ
ncbi:DUF2690 domain-containing protein, partial [Streptomyces sp. HSW2009]|uniref:DUF2690 domain-containing protein n=1 Tax=Streptomyces sp. HSW2009 TaxID=3142890 RepID=UPI0032EF2843